MDYKIRQGDTLWNIAKQNGVTVDSLVEANGIKNPDLIYAGDVIKIPDKASTSQAVQSAGAKASSVSLPSGSVSSGNLFAAESGKPVYTESEKVSAALKALEAKEAEAVPEYVSKYADKISSLLSSIENREPFSYDAMSDPLYRSFREKYLSDGKRAMKEAAANASALTGGYGNSYAASASSEALGRYMTELSGLVAPLYEAALKRYQSEGQGLYDMLSTLRSLESEDYSKYRDVIGDRKSELSYLLDKYEKLYDDDYGVYKTLLGQWNSDRDYERARYEYESDAAYKRALDEANAQYRKERDLIEDALKEREIALKESTARTAASSTSAKSGTNSQSTVKSQSTAKQASGKDTLTYDMLGSSARKLIAQIQSVPLDQRGAVREKFIESAKKAKSDGKITQKELEYIKELI